MSKTQVTSNASQVGARFKRMAKALPGVADKAVQKLVEQDALPLYRRAVSTWDHQPQFMPIKMARGWGVRVQPLYPFEYVDKGTRAHIIEAKRAMLLRFTGPYHAKSKPNTIDAYKGGRGRVWVAKKRVHHPGTEARNFSTIILKRVQARAANQIRDALLEASYGAGTGI